MYAKDFRLAAMRLLDYFGSMRKTAKALNVGVATISRWSKCIEPQEKRIRRSQTLSQQVRDFVFTTLSSSPCVTSVELCQRIQSTLQVIVSRSLVLNVIRSLGFSYKRVKKRVLTSKSSKSSQTCREFRKGLFNALSSTHRRIIISIDESGFDHRAIPFYGFSRKGTPAIVHYEPSYDRKRYNLLMAVANDGSSSFTIREGSVGSEHFSDFIRDLPFPQGSIVLLDNASIHKTRRVLKELEDKGYVAMFLPPYSPEYNPIELVFGRLKQAYYRHRLKTSQQQDIASTVQYIASDLATPELIMGCFRHVQGVVVDEMHRFEDSH